MEAASEKVKVKVKASVKVTTHFEGDEVAVASNKKAVAAAKYNAKTGKVVITGKKAGKAVVTVETDGVEKKIAVTVKKK